ncbi:MAG: YfhO family protein [Bacteroidales bacterium]|nr:YfhO family protein [Bacteroidales bacterium]
MKNIRFKQVLPYLSAVVIFVVISIAYFSPLLEGKKMKQSDITQFLGMSKEISDFRDATGQEALWTNSMFGGMPAYQISVQYKGNVLRYLDQLMQLYLPQPAGMVFLYMIGFFILLLVLKVDKWLAIAGAIAFAFSSYLFIIFEAGHNSKAHAIGYMAPVLAGIILTYRGRYLAGGIIAAIALSLELLTNHLQITYYLMLIAAVFVITELVSSIREKKLPGFAKATGVLIIASIFALATNITSIWATYEYGKETIRGKTELTSEKSNRTSGLDKDYATGWSYGKMETFTMLIPNFNGGSSQGALTETSNTYKALKANNVDDTQASKIIKALPLYWGTQPGVAGPVYIGAIIMFLFIFALFTVDNKYKWWLLAATILSIVLAWGKNFMPFTNFFMHYVPGYNKFRAVSMTLVIAELCIPLLAVLGLQKTFSGEVDKKKLLKYLYYSLGIAGGISLFFALFGSSLYDFISPADEQYKSYFPDWLMAALREDRAAILSADAFRSLAFILLAGAAIWAMINQKIKKPVFFTALILLVLIDMWSVNRRYVNNDSFVSKRVAAVPFQPSLADQVIMKDKDPDFRVFNQSVGNPFADASTSYFHKSLGGYHGAKLRRYQELIDSQLVKGNMNVYNMLNTKYFIVPDEKGGQPQMQINMQAMGNAWFVNNAHMVNNADEELNALTNFVPAETAVYDKRYEDHVKGHIISKDTLATIVLTDYKPNHLTYKSETSREQLAVFSEIYYEKGWNAFIDGKPAPYFRANYVLRAMIVPAGTHTIEFKFEPQVYKTGEKISYASSILLVLLAIGSIGFMLKRKYVTSPKA